MPTRGSAVSGCTEFNKGDRVRWKPAWSNGLGSPAARYGQGPFEISNVVHINVVDSSGFRGVGNTLRPRTKTAYAIMLPEGESKGLISGDFFELDS